MTDSDNPRRVLLKLSGEAFGGGKVGIDTQVIRRIAEEIVPAVQQGVQVAIVVGGGISKEGEWLCRRLREIVVREMFVGEMFAPPIRMATLGNDAGVIGAAALERYR